MTYPLIVLNILKFVKCEKELSNICGSITVNVNDIRYIIPKSDVVTKRISSIDSFQDAYQNRSVVSYVLHMDNGDEIEISEDEYKRKFNHEAK